MQFASLHSQNFTLAIGHLMRSLLAVAVVLFASSASAQNMWQMNAAYQNQFNSAYQSAAMPYYYRGYGYGYGSYSPIYSPSLQRQALLYEQQDQTRQLRRMNWTLQLMEWDLQDAAWQR